MLIVENGSRVPGAESLCSVADADQYFADRGVAPWALLTEAEKERALRNATDFMEGRYRERWRGRRVDHMQELSWPRCSVVIDGYDMYAYASSVPKDVKRACAELAIRAAAGPLVEDREQGVIQETVGPITTKYDQNSPTYIRYTQVDDMLRVLMRGGNAMVRLSRC